MSSIRLHLKTQPYKYIKTFAKIKPTDSLLQGFLQEVEKPHYILMIPTLLLYQST